MVEKCRRQRVELDEVLQELEIQRESIPVLLPAKSKEESTMEQVQEVSNQSKGLRTSTAYVTGLSSVLVAGTFIFFATENNQGLYWSIPTRSFGAVILVICGPIVSLLIYRGICFVLRRFVATRFAYLWAFIVSALLTGGSIVFSLGVIASMYLFYDDIKNVPIKG